MPTAEDLNRKFREDKRKREKIATIVKLPKEEVINVAISAPTQARINKLADKHGWSTRSLATALLELALEDAERLL